MAHPAQINAHTLMAAPETHRANGQRRNRYFRTLESMFGRVEKIPIANTFSELVGMDFVDYGDRAAFLRIRDTFSRFSAIIFSGAKKKEEQTAEMAKESAISEYVAFLGDTRNNDGRWGFQIYWEVVS